METEDTLLAMPNELLAIQWYIPTCSVVTLANCIHDVRMKGSGPVLLWTVAPGLSPKNMFEILSFSK